MTTINQESWNDRDGQFENSNSQAADSGIGRGGYNPEVDEDDQNLSDDDVTGRDLDVDGADEWDEANVSDTDLDEDDLEDNDEVNADLHSVKNDQFGSLASSLQNGPDPDEIPEEHALGNEELDYPDGDDTLEKGTENEGDYTHTTEVTPPEPTEAPERKAASLGNLDADFTSDKHDRDTGRTIDHEPGAGSTPPEHGAYNL